MRRATWLQLNLYVIAAAVLFLILFIGTFIGLLPFKDETHQKSIICTQKGGLFVKLYAGGYECIKR